MSNKRETIEGTLNFNAESWEVKSGYGVFPLAKTLQRKPSISSDGGEVEATVFHGEVIDYHFIETAAAG